MTKSKMKQPKNSKKIDFAKQNLRKSAKVDFEKEIKLKHESLILAQDERWRRA